MAIVPISTDSNSFVLRGKILRKKKVIPNLLRLNIQCDGDEHTTPIHVPLDKNDEICNGFNMFYLEAAIEASGYVAKDDVTDEDLKIVDACKLITCAPNVKMIKDMLSMLPNITSYASCFNMSSDDLELLLQKPQKTILHEILSNLNGVGKAPPRKRLARLRYPDMQILQCKETGDAEWELCRPCNISFSFEPRRQSISNVPKGAQDSISHHHKLTRRQYLEEKKNKQTLWFVERLKKFKKKPRCFLDVGGGRGDLAVALALAFEDSRVIAVDCNRSSIDAGKLYARQCEVDDRIEFIEMNFSRYVEECKAEKHEIDCIVALHACGDLSDMALSLARSINCDFIICPCCYTKRYLAPFIPYWHQYCTEGEVDSLTRLVELDDHRDISRRAMVVINSMRLNAFGEDVRLEEFDSKISRRNIVIIAGVLGEGSTG